jgi:N-acetylmuramoyl-L-alanine amidase
MILETAALCLALNVFHESRSEPLTGQYAVASVTFNRAERDQERVCDVVFASKQFSWTRGVRLTKRGWEIPARLINLTNAEPEAWARAWKVARLTLNGRATDNTRGAEFYHANYVQPAWRLKMKWVKTVGTHHFYRA